MNIFNHFRSIVGTAIDSLIQTGDLPAECAGSNFVVEPPRDPAHGDIATNAAMVMAKPAKMPPRAIAEKLAGVLSRSDEVSSAEVAGPGFINLKIGDALWYQVVTSALEAGDAYGSSALGRSEKVNVEYVSVNPTGPLHVGHCRGAVFGDALAALLETCGYDVTKEYYINDAGAQIDVVARSAYLRYREALGEDIGEIPSGLYPGEYLIALGQQLAAEHGDSLMDAEEPSWLPKLRRAAIDFNMAIIRDDLKALNIEHDVFFSEQSLHDRDDDASSGIETSIAKLRARNLVFEGRLPPPKGQVPEDWEDREQTLFRATEFGDDVDRPLMKSDGSYTYFAADVAYFQNKFDREFKQMIYVLGADHGGYVKRLQAVCAAVAGEDAQAIVRLCQLVKFLRGGAPARMSKRAGTFVTLRDVVDEVGPDVVRFMMLYRKNEAPLDFDFEKVTEQSRDNPVFYVQYAHARICSVFRTAAEELGAQAPDLEQLKQADLSLLGDPAEMAIIRRIADYPRVLEGSALNHEPHRVAFYLYDLASDFHALWNRGKESPQLRFIIGKNFTATFARLALLQATQYVLMSGLRILGVTPAREM
ncbi:MAG: arginine--tRNA ligase [Pseudomonadota bacterium]